jgi:hypothetical protein
VAVDSSGNAYVTGEFASSSMTVGAYTLSNGGIAHADVFVAKLNSTGGVTWAKRFGSTLGDHGMGVDVDSSGNTYVTGSFASSMVMGAYTLSMSGVYDVFVAKLDSNGGVTWARRFGGASSDSGRSVAVDSSGNAYVTGDFSSSSMIMGSTLSTAGSSDVFVAKLSSTGGVSWASRFGGASDDYGYGVAVDSSGNAYVTGRFKSSSMTMGAYTLTNTGDSNVFVAKLSSNQGAVTWASRFGGASEDEGRSVAVDLSGNAYVTGSFSSSSMTMGTYTLTNAGSSDVFVAKLSSTGGVTWASRFGGASSDGGRSVAVDSSGDAYVTGWFSSSMTMGAYTLTNAGAWDVFVAKLSSTGGVTWASRFGGTPNDGGNGVAVDSSGNAYVAGWFLSSSMAVGAYTLSTAGLSDVIVAMVS